MVSGYLFTIKNVASGYNAFLSWKLFFLFYVCFKIVTQKERSILDKLEYRRKHHSEY